MRINDKFKNLIKSDDTIRYYIIVGGRGSSKSYTTSTFLTGLTFEKGHIVLYTRYTMSSAHLSIIPEFIEKIELFGMNDQFDITKSEITNKLTNSNILFRGIRTSSGNQTAALKSIQGVTTWVIDEAEELVDESIFDKIDLSIRQQGMHNRVIIILNPTSKEHWIYKKFYESRGVDPYFNGIKGDTCYIHTDYRDNIENLSESYIQNIMDMKERRPDKYKHQILGAWTDKAEGVIFNNWTTGEFNPDKQLTIFGQDYGFSIDPTTLIEVAINKKKKKLYVKECFVKTGMSTSDIVLLNQEYAGANIIVGDSAEPRLINEIRGKGCNLHAVKKGKDSIITGIALMQDYDIIVDPDSIEIIKEFNNYIWHDKKSKTPIDKYNHCIDSIRYAMYFTLNNPTYGTYSIY